MGFKKELIRKLKEHGFEKVSYGKHEKWSNGERNIMIPTGKPNQRTLLSVFQQIEGRGPFFRRQQMYSRKR